MTRQFDLYGVFLPSFAVLALFAYGMFRLFAWVLCKAGL